jgi:hypothetical protein
MREYKDNFIALNCMKQLDFRPVFNKSINILNRRSDHSKTYCSSFELLNEIRTSNHLAMTLKLLMLTNDQRWIILLENIKDALEYQSASTKARNN